MPSVARRIRTLLEARLLTIDGTGEMVYDVGANVFGYRPTIDTEIEAMPAVFIFRREGGEERNGTPEDTCIDKVVIYDVVGIVPAGPPWVGRCSRRLACRLRARPRASGRSLPCRWWREAA
jgi:hypothetical protein